MYLRHFFTAHRQLRSCPHYLSKLSCQKLTNTTLLDCLKSSFRYLCCMLFLNKYLTSTINIMQKILLIIMWWMSITYCSASQPGVCHHHPPDHFFSLNSKLAGLWWRHGEAVDCPMFGIRSVLSFPEMEQFVTHFVKYYKI